ncbi:MAG TPA: tRNA preQ1(34) S-adenosylmethionine ribosyltransferase-isomerase QueA [Polyangiaceae bacterium]|nr:tRNA preQ1(34) S-adenosylmethionine ribosyltransferase-isomerase QueA [Polyangiaceae bacterium]
MRVELLDYELPESAIAQRPLARREMARMLVIDSTTSQLGHREVRDWPKLVPAGALVVLNDTRVVKARLLGTKPSGGGKAELLLVEPSTAPSGAGGKEQKWRAIGKGLGRLQGQPLIFGEGALTAVVEGPSRTEGLFDVTLVARTGSVEAALDEHGHVPVPPYIRRADDATDVERYQTVYARAAGAIAAPTAGLHLTEELLAELRQRDVRIGFLTLHVGLGTFQPVAVDDLDQHPMHAEWMQVDDALVSEIAAARARSAPVVAVGTTVVRALEAAADPERQGHVVRTEGKTNLLLQPGYRFRVVDALLTNFHLPRSTLLALVAAFAGQERILAAYREAVRAGYRFFSYGDAMWIPRRADSDGALVSRARGTAP